MWWDMEVCWDGSHSDVNGGRGQGEGGSEAQCVMWYTSPRVVLVIILHICCVLFYFHESSLFTPFHCTPYHPSLFTHTVPHCATLCHTPLPVLFIPTTTIIIFHHSLVSFVFQFMECEENINNYKYISTLLVTILIHGMIGKRRGREGGKGRWRRKRKRKRIILAFTQPIKLHFFPTSYTICCYKTISL